MDEPAAVDNACPSNRIVHVRVAVFDVRPQRNGRMCLRMGSILEYDMVVIGFIQNVSGPTPGTGTPLMRELSAKAVYAAMTDRRSV